MIWLFIWDELTIDYVLPPIEGWLYSIDRRYRIFNKFMKVKSMTRARGILDNDMVCI